MRRSDESPPPQHRRSLLLPLKQLSSLSMVLMVTSLPSQVRPPPDRPPSSPCKSRPFKTPSLNVPPEPPDPPDDPLLLAPIQIHESSHANPVGFLPRDIPDPPVLFASGWSSPVPVAAASPLSFFASTSVLTGSVFVLFGVWVSTAWCRLQLSSSSQLETQFSTRTTSLFVKLSKGIVSVSFWSRTCSKGVSCVEMSPFPSNKDITLYLNLPLPQFEDVTSALPLPRYEDVTPCYPLLVPQDEVVIRTFLLLALVSMVSGTDAFKIGGFGWCIHGMDEAQDSQNSSRKVHAISTLAAEALTLQEALLQAFLAGLSKLQVILDSIGLSPFRDGFE